MGYNQTDFVYAVTLDEDPELNKFVKKYPKLFFMKHGTTNSWVNYVMIYDGSKEGWSDSDDADKIRERFIKKCKEVEASWWHVSDGESDEYPRMVSHKSDLVMEMK